MNMGYEDDELKPYQEVQPDLNDAKRIGKTGTVQMTKQFFHSTRFDFLILSFYKAHDFFSLYKTSNELKINCKECFFVAFYICY